MPKRSSHKRNKAQLISKRRKKSFVRWIWHIRQQLFEVLRIVGGVSLAFVLVMSLVVLIEQVASNISQATWPTISLQVILTIAAFIAMLGSLSVMIIVFLIIWLWRKQEEQAARDKLKQKHENLLSDVHTNVESLFKPEVQ